MTSPAHLGIRPTPIAVRNIIVLSHNRETARLFQRYLDGYHIMHAASWKDVQCQGQRHPIHGLILATQNLDNEWHEQMVADSRLRAVPIFTFSGNAPGMIEGMPANVTFLAKPFTQEPLLEAIQSACGSARDILIVEDDTEIAQLLERMVQANRRGCRIRKAVDGAEALVQMREVVPDLVLLDLLLPQVSGPEVVQEMKADPALCSVPIIITSARRPGEEIPRFRNLELSRGDGWTVGDVMKCLQGSLDALLGDAPIGSAQVQPKDSVALLA